MRTCRRGKEGEGKQRQGGVWRETREGKQVGGGGLSRGKGWWEQKQEGGGREKGEGKREWCRWCGTKMQAAKGKRKPKLLSCVTGKGWYRGEGCGDAWEMGARGVCIGWRVVVAACDSWTANGWITNPVESRKRSVADSSTCCVSRAVSDNANNAATVGCVSDRWLCRKGRGGGEGARAGRRRTPQQTWQSR